MPIQSWFPTRIYVESLQRDPAKVRDLHQRRLHEIEDIRALDGAGFTSYA